MSQKNQRASELNLSETVFSAKWTKNRLLVPLPTVKPVSRIAEEFHLVSNSSESSTEYRCKFSLKSALQYELAFNLTDEEEEEEEEEDEEERKEGRKKIEELLSAGKEISPEL